MTAPNDLKAILTAGLQRVDPLGMILDHVRLAGDRLRLSRDQGDEEIDLTVFDRIAVLGAGKASARMAQGLEQVLGDRIGDGLVVVKTGHALPLRHIRVLEASHPTPDDAGVEAARQLADYAGGLDERCLAILLISGGGSALLPAPRPPLSLADKQATTAALLACGADIHEVNCVRKHLSALKGGGLARLLAPARCLALILSDVVGDRLDSISSGLTAADPTTFADALAVISRYGLDQSLPASVMALLRRGDEGHEPETAKPGDAALARVTNAVIGSNRAAVLAARDKARSLGYDTLALTSSLTGEAREVAKLLFAIARDCRDGGLLAPAPACLIAGGESVVTVSGTGSGGRNQEMALAFLAEMAGDPQGGRDIAFLSAATDGGDGPTDAAGAFATPEVLVRARALGLSPTHFLGNNDSYGFFDRLGGLLRTGPTGTNVCDLQIILVGSPHTCT
ncbi:hydroxypyruvate reductase [Paramagnetospirillum marisnigri]|uniref:Hydroxypyruvate reductase n=1 Tax=Paramagnetospirillum marisnigri TaxID=1285242 RepID=A0A178MJ42_9PROT|nr:glycerate kinase [Paramagnetospirillum marisnigri]OAN48177.1 hydroxypyruvate reductase [Paramagnetospirillum marisnigri]